MNGLLSNPYFSTAILPFIVAFLTAWLLNRIHRAWAGLAVVTGFYICAYLITGMQLVPITSTSKILVMGMVVVAIAIVLDLVAKPRHVKKMLTILGVAAAIWLVWPLVMRQHDLKWWLLTALMVAYVAWLPPSLYELRKKPLRATTAVFSLALGTGIMVLLGASAKLGQLGSALAASAGAYLFLQVFVFKVRSAGAVLLVPAALLCGLIGMAGYIYASMPWYGMPLLAAVPLLANIPLPESYAVWVQEALLLLVTLGAALAAIYLTWLETGSPLL